MNIIHLNNSNKTRSLKSLFFAGLIVCATPWVWTQSAAQTQDIQDPKMVISGINQLELMPSNRAVPQTNQPNQGNVNAPTFSIITTTTTAPISNMQLAVAYDHTLNTRVFLTGEVTFKLKTGFSLSSLQTSLQSITNATPSLLVAPNVYVFYATSPKQIVTLSNQLKASSAVEWVEVYVIHGRVN